MGRYVIEVWTPNQLRLVKEVVESVEPERICRPMKPPCLKAPVCSCCGNPIEGTPNYCKECGARVIK